MTSYGSTLEAPNHADEYGDQTSRSFHEQNGHTNGNDNSVSPATGFMKYKEQEPLKPISTRNGNVTNRSDPNYLDAQNTQKGQNLSLEYGKTIRLLRNGDEFFRGHKFVINSRKYRYFDVFMDDISNDLNANFGAIRKIHTPVNGHRIKSLDEMEDGKTYVAAGNSRFIKINYTDVLEGRRPAPNNRLPAIARTDYSNFVVNQYDTPQNALIYVYRNGDALTQPAKILLYKTTLSSYDAVLDQISTRVKLPNGAVFKLFSMDGDLVRGSSEIISGNSYVAAHKERFKKIDYFAGQDFNTSPRFQRKTNSQPSYASTSSSKTNSSFGNKYNGWRKENSNPQTLPNNLPPVRVNKSRVNVNVNVDKDPSGLYKARTNQGMNADTVDEAPNMFVDQPIDFKRAEQVDDEFMNDRKAEKYNHVPPINTIPQNQISKPNSKPPPSQIRDPSPKREMSPLTTRRSPTPTTQRSPSPAQVAVAKARSPSPARSIKQASPDILPQPDTSRDIPESNNINDSSRSITDDNKYKGFASSLETQEDENKYKGFAASIENQRTYTIDESSDLKKKRIKNQLPEPAFPDELSQSLNTNEDLERISMDSIRERAITKEMLENRARINSQKRSLVRDKAIVRKIITEPFDNEFEADQSKKEIESVKEENISVKNNEQIEEIKAESIKETKSELNVEGLDALVNMMKNLDESKINIADFKNLEEDLKENKVDSLTNNNRKETTNAKKDEKLEARDNYNLENNDKRIISDIKIFKEKPIEDLSRSNRRDSLSSETEYLKINRIITDDMKSVMLVPANDDSDDDRI